MAANKNAITQPKFELGITGIKQMCVRKNSMEIININLTFYFSFISCGLVCVQSDGVMQISFRLTAVFGPNLCLH